MQNREAFPFRPVGLVIGLCFALLLVSCDNSPTGSEEPEECRSQTGDVLQPLAKDNYWQRTHEVTGDDSGPDTNRTFVDKKMQIEIDGNSYNASIVKRTSRVTGSIDEVSRLLWNGPEGLYTLGMIGPKDTLLIEPHLQYKYPVSAGETWKLLNITYNDIKEKVEVSDTLTATASRVNEIIEVSDSTFNTVVYHYYNKQSVDVAGYWHYFKYFSSRVGHVKTTLYSHPDSILAYSERNNHNYTNLDVKTNLINYCLK